MLDKLFDFLIQFVALFKFWAVYEPFEAGVLLRLGTFIRVLEPGFHWRIPFGVDQCLSAQTVPTVHSLGDESITTTDGKNIGFHAVVTFQVRDIKKALLDVSEVTHAVLDACAGEVGRVLREASWAEVMAPDMLDKLTKACRARGFRYGIEVMQVQLAGVSLVRSIRLMQK
jgi:regulator of protease activity HflC (stomatin/prohibitin superfamily)